MLPKLHGKGFRRSYKASNFRKAAVKKNKIMRKCWKKSFASYIQDVTNYIHPNFTLSKGGLSALNDLVEYILERIVSEFSSFTCTRDRAVGIKEIQRSIHKLFFSQGLFCAEHCIYLAKKCSRICHSNYS